MRFKQKKRSFLVSTICFFLLGLTCLCASDVFSADKNPGDKSEKISPGAKGSAELSTSSIETSSADRPSLKRRRVSGAEDSGPPKKCLRKRKHTKGAWRKEVRQQAEERRARAEEKDREVGVVRRGKGRSRVQKESQPGTSQSAVRRQKRAKVRRLAELRLAEARRSVARPGDSSEESEAVGQTSSVGGISITIDMKELFNREKREKGLKAQAQRLSRAKARTAQASAELEQRSQGLRRRLRTDRFIEAPLRHSAELDRLEEEVSARRETLRKIREGRNQRRDERSFPMSGIFLRSLWSINQDREAVRTERGEDLRSAEERQRREEEVRREERERREREEKEEEELTAQEHAKEAELEQELAELEGILNGGRAEEARLYAQRGERLIARVLEEPSPFVQALLTRRRDLSFSDEVEPVPLQSPVSSGDASFQIQSPVSPGDSSSKTPESRELLTHSGSESSDFVAQAFERRSSADSFFSIDFESGSSLAQSPEFMEINPQNSDTSGSQIFDGSQISEAEMREPSGSSSFVESEKDSESSTRSLNSETNTADEARSLRESSSSDELGSSGLGRLRHFSLTYRGNPLPPRNHAPPPPSFDEEPGETGVTGVLGFSLSYSEPPEPTGDKAPPPPLPPVLDSGSSDSGDSDASAVGSSDASDSDGEGLGRRAPLQAGAQAGNALGQAGRPGARGPIGVGDLLESLSPGETLGLERLFVEDRQEEAPVVRRRDPATVRSLRALGVFYRGRDRDASQEREAQEQAAAERLRQEGRAGARVSWREGLERQRREDEEERLRLEIAEQEKLARLCAMREEEERAQRLQALLRDRVALQALRPEATDRASISARREAFRREMLLAEQKIEAIDGEVRALAAGQDLGSLQDRAFGLFERAYRRWGGGALEPEEGLRERNLERAYRRWRGANFGPEEVLRDQNLGLSLEELYTPGIPRIVRLPEKFQRMLRGWSLLNENLERRLAFLVREEFKFLQSPNEDEEVAGGEKEAFFKELDREVRERRALLGIGFLMIQKELLRGKKALRDLQISLENHIEQEDEEKRRDEERRRARLAIAAEESALERRETAAAVARERRRREDDLLEPFSPQVRNARGRIARFFLKEFSLRAETLRQEMQWAERRRAEIFRQVRSRTAEDLGATRLRTNQDLERFCQEYVDRNSHVVIDREALLREQDVGLRLEDFTSGTSIRELDIAFSRLLGARVLVRSLEENIARYRRRRVEIQDREGDPRERERQEEVLSNIEREFQNKINDAEIVVLLVRHSLLDYKIELCRHRISINENTAASINESQRSNPQSFSSVRPPRSLACLVDAARGSARLARNSDWLNSVESLDNLRELFENRRMEEAEEARREPLRQEIQSAEQRIAAIEREIRELSAGENLEELQSRAYQSLRNVQGRYERFSPSPEEFLREQDLGVSLEDLSDDPEALTGEDSSLLALRRGIFLNVGLTVSLEFLRRQCAQLMGDEGVLLEARARDGLKLFRLGRKKEKERTLAAIGVLMVKRDLLRAKIARCQRQIDGSVGDEVLLCLKDLFAEPGEESSSVGESSESLPSAEGSGPEARQAAAFAEEASASRVSSDEEASDAESSSSSSSSEDGWVAAARQAADVSLEDDEDFRSLSSGDSDDDDREDGGASGVLEHVVQYDGAPEPPGNRALPPPFDEEPGETGVTGVLGFSLSYGEPPEPTGDKAPPPPLPPVLGSDSSDDSDSAASDSEGEGSEPEARPQAGVQAGNAQKTDKRRASSETPGEAPQAPVGEASSSKDSGSEKEDGPPAKRRRAEEEGPKPEGIPSQTEQPQAAEPRRPESSKGKARQKRTREVSVSEGEGGSAKPSTMEDPPAARRRIQDTIGLLQSLDLSYEDGDEGPSQKQEWLRQAETEAEAEVLRLIQRQREEEARRSADPLSQAQEVQTEAARQAEEERREAERERRRLEEREREARLEAEYFAPVDVEEPRQEEAGQAFSSSIQELRGKILCSQLVRSLTEAFWIDACNKRRMLRKSLQAVLSEREKAEEAGSAAPFYTIIQKQEAEARARRSLASAQNAQGEQAGTSAAQPPSEGRPQAISSFEELLRGFPIAQLTAEVADLEIISRRAGSLELGLFFPSAQSGLEEALYRERDALRRARLGSIDENLRFIQAKSAECQRLREILPQNISEDRAKERLRRIEGLEISLAQRQAGLLILKIRLQTQLLWDQERILFFHTREGYAESARQELIGYDIREGYAESMRRELIDYLEQNPRDDEGPTEDEDDEDFFQGVRELLINEGVLQNADEEAPEQEVLFQDALNRIANALNEGGSSADGTRGSADSARGSADGSEAGGQVASGSRTPGSVLTSLGFGEVSSIGEEERSEGLSDEEELSDLSVILRASEDEQSESSEETVVEVKERESLSSGDQRPVEEDARQVERALLQGFLARIDEARRARRLSEDGPGSSSSDSGEGEPGVSTGLEAGAQEALGERRNIASGPGGGGGPTKFFVAATDEEEASGKTSLRVRSSSEEFVAATDEEEESAESDVEVGGRESSSSGGQSPVEEDRRRAEREMLQGFLARIDEARRAWRPSEAGTGFSSPASEAGTAGSSAEDADSSEAESQGYLSSAESVDEEESSGGKTPGSAPASPGSVASRAAEEPRRIVRGIVLVSSDEEEVIASDEDDAVDEPELGLLVENVARLRSEVEELRQEAVRLGGFTEARRAELESLRTELREQESALALRRLEESASFWRSDRLLRPRIARNHRLLERSLPSSVRDRFLSTTGTNVSVPRGESARREAASGPGEGLGGFLAAELFYEEPGDEAPPPPFDEEPGENGVTGALGFSLSYGGSPEPPGNEAPPLPLSPVLDSGSSDSGDSAVSAVGSSDSGDSAASVVGSSDASDSDGEAPGRYASLQAGAQAANAAGQEGRPGSRGSADSADLLESLGPGGDSGLRRLFSQSGDGDLLDAFTPGETLGLERLFVEAPEAPVVRSRNPALMDALRSLGVFYRGRAGDAPRGRARRQEVEAARLRQEEAEAERLRQEEEQAAEAEVARARQRQQRAGEARLTDVNLLRQARNPQAFATGEAARERLREDWLLEIAEHERALEQRDMREARERASVARTMEERTPFSPQIQRLRGRIAGSAIRAFFENRRRLCWELRSTQQRIEEISGQISARTDERHEVVRRCAFALFMSARSRYERENGPIPYDRDEILRRQNLGLSLEAVYRPETFDILDFYLPLLQGNTLLGVELDARQVVTRCRRDQLRQDAEITPEERSIRRVALASIEGAIQKQRADAEIAVLMIKESLLRLKAIRCRVSITEVIERAHPIASSFLLRSETFLLEVPVRLAGAPAPGRFAEFLAGSEGRSSRRVFDHGRGNFFNRLREDESLGLARLFREPGSDDFIDSLGEDESLGLERLFAEPGEESSAVAASDLAARRESSSSEEDFESRALRSAEGGAAARVFSEADDMDFWSVSSGDFDVEPSSSSEDEEGDGASAGYVVHYDGDPEPPDNHAPRAGDPESSGNHAQPSAASFDEEPGETGVTGALGFSLSYGGSPEPPGNEAPPLPLSPVLDSGSSDSSDSDVSAVGSSDSGDSAASVVGSSDASDSDGEGPGRYASLQAGAQAANAAGQEGRPGSRGSADSADLLESLGPGGDSGLRRLFSQSGDGDLLDAFTPGETLGLERLFAESSQREAPVVRSRNPALMDALRSLGVFYRGRAGDAPRGRARRQEAEAARLRQEEAEAERLRQEEQASEAEVVASLQQQRRATAFGLSEGRRLYREKNPVAVAMWEAERERQEREEAEAREKREAEERAAEERRARVRLEIAEHETILEQRETAEAEARERARRQAEVFQPFSSQARSIRWHMVRPTLADFVLNMANFHQEEGSAEQKIAEIDKQLRERTGGEDMGKLQMEAYGILGQARWEYEESRGYTPFNREKVLREQCLGITPEELYDPDSPESWYNIDMKLSGLEAFGFFHRSLDRRLREERFQHARLLQRDITSQEERARREQELQAVEREIKKQRRLVKIGVLLLKKNLLLCKVDYYKIRRVLELRDMSLRRSVFRNSLQSFSQVPQSRFSRLFGETRGLSASSERSSGELEGGGSLEILRAGFENRRREEEEERRRVLREEIQSAEQRLAVIESQVRERSTGEDLEGLQARIYRGLRTAYASFGGPARYSPSPEEFLNAQNLGIRVEDLSDNPEALTAGSPPFPLLQACRLLNLDMDIDLKSARNKHAEMAQAAEVSPEDLANSEQTLLRLEQSIQKNRRFVELGVLMIRMDLLRAKIARCASQIDRNREAAGAPDVAVRQEASSSGEGFGSRFSSSVEGEAAADVPPSGEEGSETASTVSSSVEEGVAARVSSAADDTDLGGAPSGDSDNEEGGGAAAGYVVHSDGDSEPPGNEASPPPLPPVLGSGSSDSGDSEPPGGHDPRAGDPGPLGDEAPPPPLDEEPGENGVTGALGFSLSYGGSPEPPGNEAPPLPLSPVLDSGSSDSGDSAASVAGSSDASDSDGEGPGRYASLQAGAQAANAAGQEGRPGSRGSADSADLLESLGPGGDSGLRRLFSQSGAGDLLEVLTPGETLGLERLFAEAPQREDPVVRPRNPALMDALRSLGVFYRGRAGDAPRGRARRQEAEAARLRQEEQASEAEVVASLQQQRRATAFSLSEGRRLYREKNPVAVAMWEAERERQEREEEESKRPERREEERRARVRLEIIENERLLDQRERLEFHLRERRSRAAEARAPFSDQARRLRGRIVEVGIGAFVEERARLNRELCSLTERKVILESQSNKLSGGDVKAVRDRARDVRSRSGIAERSLRFDRERVLREQGLRLRVEDFDYPETSPLLDFYLRSLHEDAVLREELAERLRRVGLRRSELLRAEGVTPEERDERAAASLEEELRGEQEVLNIYDLQALHEEAALRNESEERLRGAGLQRSEFLWTEGVTLEGRDERELASLEEELREAQEALKIYDLKLKKEVLELRCIACELQLSESLGNFLSSIRDLLSKPGGLPDPRRRIYVRENLLSNRSAATAGASVGSASGLNLAIGAEEIRLDSLREFFENRRPESAGVFELEEAFLDEEDEEDDSDGSRSETPVDHRGDLLAVLGDDETLGVERLFIVADNEPSGAEGRSSSSSEQEGLGLAAGQEASSSGEGFGSRFSSSVEGEAAADVLPSEEEGSETASTVLSFVEEGVAARVSSAADDTDLGGAPSGDSDNEEGGGAAAGYVVCYAGDPEPSDNHAPPPAASLSYGGSPEPLDNEAPPPPFDEEPGESGVTGALGFSLSYGGSPEPPDNEAPPLPLPPVLDSGSSDSSDSDVLAFGSSDAGDSAASAVGSSDSSDSDASDSDGEAPGRCAPLQAGAQVANAAGQEGRPGSRGSADSADLLESLGPGGDSGLRRLFSQPDDNAEDLLDALGEDETLGFEDLFNEEESEPKPSTPSDKARPRLFRTPRPLPIVWLDYDFATQQQALFALREGLASQALQTHAQTAGLIFQITANLPQVPKICADVLQGESAGGEEPVSIKKERDLPKILFKEPSVQRPCRLFASMQASKSLTLTAASSAQVGVVINPFSEIRFGAAYAYGQDPLKKQEITKSDGAGYAKIGGEQNVFSSFVGWNLARPGLNALVIASKGWGKTKLQRCFLQDKELSQGKGRAAAQTSGVLLQLSYAFDLKPFLPDLQSILLTPYARIAASRIKFASYVEKNPRRAFAFHSTQSSIFERAFGLETRLGFCDDYEVQLWTSLVRGQKTTDGLYARAADVDLALPRKKSDYLQGEIGVSFNVKLTEALGCGISGSVRMQRQKGVESANATARAWYDF